MLIFHALARLEIESLVFVSPQTPLVSIGYFQGLDGVDLDYCNRHGISVMRRELGGGTTLLDKNQIFYQIILKKNNPMLPGSIDLLYRKFSQPVINTYASLGIKTKFKPINDIMTLDGKKISGEGGGDIGNCIVFVGGILLDFNFGMMSRVLRVPDEKFRDKVYKTMEEGLTTLRRELGYVPERQEIIKIMSCNFEKIMGPLIPAGLPEGVWTLAGQLEQQLAPDRLRRRNIWEQEGIKINADVRLKRGVFKAPGGLIQTAITIKNGIIEDLQILGDFTLYPKDSLSYLVNGLLGVKYQYAAVKSRIEELFTGDVFEIPGISPDDICQAVIENNGQGE